MVTGGVSKGVPRKDGNPHGWLAHGSIAGEVLRRMLVVESKDAHDGEEGSATQRERMVLLNQTKR
jgi:hypothetical protein